MALLLNSARSSDLNTDRKRLRGKVIDVNTKEVLIGATVYVQELKTGTATDINGMFMLKLTEGKYTLKISYIGYKSSIETIDIGDNISQTFSLENESREIGDVVVKAQRTDENITRTEMGVERIKMQTMRQIPALMGEVDVIKAIQLLPGVQATAEGSSGFSVRGGNFDQNLILVDEAPIYNASHLMGFFSVFNNDAVNDIELYKGDIPVAYGGRLSSLLDVSIKEGNDQLWHATGGLGTISSRLTIQGPLWKNKTSVLLAGRRSYADIVFFPFSKQQAVRDATLFFYDINAKIKHKFNSKNTLILNGYIGQDKFGQKFAEFSFGNKTASAIWKHTYNENVITNVTGIYSEYGYTTYSSFTEASSINLVSRLRDFGIKVDNTIILDDQNTIKFGLSSIHHRFFPGLIEPKGEESFYSRTELPHNSALEWGVYGSNIQELGDKLTLRYGVRFSIFQNVGPGTLYNFDDEYNVVDSSEYKMGDVYNVYQGMEPRVGLVYKLNPLSSIKTSYARTRQYVHMASNSAGGTPLDVWIASNPNIKPQIADQVATGYFRNFLGNQIETSVELYYKNMMNTIDFKDHAQLLLNKHIDGEFRIGRSWAYGAEFMVRLNMEKWNGWVSYTLSKTKREIPEINNGNIYIAPYDRPNDVSIVLNYNIAKRITISANWVYATGSPMTIPAGNYSTDNVQVPVYTARNGYRMPAYHRLDLGVTLKNKQKEGRIWESEWNFSAYNAYARHNVWAINFVPEEDNPSQLFAEKTYLFSIVPSITYNFKF